MRTMEERDEHLARLRGDWRLRLYPIRECIERGRDPLTFSRWVYIPVKGRC